MNCPTCGLPHPDRNPYCFCRGPDTPLKPQVRRYDETLSAFDVAKRELWPDKTEHPT